MSFALRLDKLGGVIDAPEPLTGSSCGWGFTWNHTHVLPPPILFPASHHCLLASPGSPSLINHLHKNVWLRLCFWENLISVHWAGSWLSSCVQALWTFCFWICFSIAGKSPGIPKFISSQTSPPPLKAWGPPAAWAFCTKWLKRNQHFLIAYCCHLCTYFHFIFSSIFSSTC